MRTEIKIRAIKPGIGVWASELQLQMREDGIALTIGNGNGDKFTTLLNPKEFIKLVSQLSAFVEGNTDELQP